MNAARKQLAVLAVIACVFGIITAAAARPVKASAQRSGPPVSCYCSEQTHRASVGYVIDHYKGIAMGGNRYTGYGVAHVTGWTHHSDGHGNSWYSAKFYLTYNPPTLAQRKRDRAAEAAERRRSCPWWINFCYDGHPIWNDAKTWDWPALFAWETRIDIGFYNAVIKPCATGVAWGNYGYAQGIFITKIAVFFEMAGWTAVKATPQGFAVATIGGCLTGLLKRAGS